LRWVLESAWVSLLVSALVSALRWVLELERQPASVLE
jgi:hypothetical protein